MATREDPLVRSARREALLVTAILVAAMIYSQGYCAVYAYNRSAEEIEIVLGFPDWVFWGVLVPWLVCAAVSILFALCVMRDDPLGEAAENQSPEEG